MSEVITKDIEAFFVRYPTAKDATIAMIELLIGKFETEGTIAGYTFSSIVSEMDVLSEPVRAACTELYMKMQDIYSNKLELEGFSKDAAHSLALMMAASIEGGIMLCLTQKSSHPLKVISYELSKILVVK
ncbi:LmrA/YxaF family transcription factor [Neobacillus drentensis]|uniref:LmrA/YxaF family transcription factor n=1 Tax=Neobacillus drentensis TaxID=220684 RepID=UPI002FFF7D3F